jgi:hypothetical protein
MSRVSRYPKPFMAPTWVSRLRMPIPGSPFPWRTLGFRPVDWLFFALAASAIVAAGAAVCYASGVHRWTCEGEQ